MDGHFGGPTYLLDRGEPMRSPADVLSTIGEESASCSEDDAPEWRFERRVDRWSCDAATSSASRRSAAVGRSAAGAPMLFEHLAS